MIDIKRSYFIKTVSFFCAAILVLIGMLIKERAVSNDYKLQIQNEYSKSISELNAQLNSISLTLEKAVYSSGGENLSGYASKLFGEAALAKNAVSFLPNSDRLETVNRFLSQVGNYALSLSKNSIMGQEITAEQKNNLKKLSATAKKISESVNDTQILYNNSENLIYLIEEKLKGEIEKGSLANTLSELEENLTDYPTLLYDGPYSDHIINKTPLMTANAYEVTKETALKNLVNFFMFKDEDFSYNEGGGGKIESYRFTRGNITAAVSKKGGFIVYMRNSRPISSGEFSYQKSLQKARDFLIENGLENMKETYYYTDEGVCVINFAFLDGQTLCYTDLIKVGVATDNGEIVFYESAGYLTNHTERSFVSPALTAEDAAKDINSELSIEKTTITLIPSDGGSEVRCYEFLCKNADGDEILVYVDLMTGKEKEIMVLLKNDNGILAK